MLAAIELGLPRQATQLKIEGHKIERENHAEHGTVRPPSITYFKKEVPNPNTKAKKKWIEIDGLETLKEFQSEYKDRVLSLARYPYAVGLYLAPACVVDQLLALKESFEARLNGIWTNWADNVYPEWRESAPQRMGGFYNEADFPDLVDCCKRFKAELKMFALAEKDQVDRIALISTKSQQLLKDHADATTREAIGELHKGIWNDLLKPLQNIVTVFNKDKKRIHETLLGNLFDIVNVIPNYKDLCQDPDLEAAATECREAFGQLTVEMLRESEEHQRTALVKATQLVTKFQPFARRFS